MQIVEQEIPAVLTIPPGQAPNYDNDNPVWMLLKTIEDVGLAADREHYIVDSLQYLLPIASVALYGPSGDQWQVRDPRLQDNKNDFQKQNVRSFTLTGTRIVRGFATAGKWAGCMLHIEHMPLPASPLVGADGVYRGNVLKAYLRIGDVSTGGQPIDLPYNPETGRFEVELWSTGGQGLDSALGPKAQAARQRGALLFRPDLVRGSYEDLYGQRFNDARIAARQQGRGVEMLDYEPNHALHPIRPLQIELAFADEHGNVWEPGGGRNYRYRYAMSFRGWSHYLGVGESSNPHGGIGMLEYRNLYSNYFGYEARRRQIFGADALSELGRELEAWNFDAYGRKPPGAGRESFMSVDYMDLHILKPNAIIGIHRHRDNQEAFLLMEGKALMVVGDWASPAQDDRVFEIRTMRPGDIAIVKGGGMHALANTLDENVLLFMFGGYD